MAFPTSEAVNRAFEAYVKAAELLTNVTVMMEDVALRTLDISDRAARHANEPGISSEAVELGVYEHLRVDDFERVRSELVAAIRRPQDD